MRSQLLSFSLHHLNCSFYVQRITSFFLLILHYFTFIYQDTKDRYKIQAKPHGHGDIHALMYTQGVAKQWEDSGIKWTIFFQVSRRGENVIIVDHHRSIGFALMRHCRIPMVLRSILCLWHWEFQRRMGSS